MMPKKDNQAKWMPAPIYSSLPQAFLGSRSGFEPTTEVLLAWINRDGEAGTQGVPSSLTGEMKRSVVVLYRRRPAEMSLKGFESRRTDRHTSDISSEA